MKSKIKNILWLVAIFLTVLVFQIAEAADGSATGTNAPVLSLTIRCTNEVVKAGDEISIEFRIINAGTNDYRYRNRTYDRSGRMPEYMLVATNSSGEAVLDVFKAGGFGGGGFQYAMLKPGESFTKIISLNRWAMIKGPGRYDVTGTYYAEVVSNNPSVSSVPTISSIPIASDPIVVNVLPRPGKEMDAYISDLTNQIASLSPKQIFPYGSYSPGSVGPTPQLDELLERLTYTCNPQIVPTLLDTMYLPGHGGFWESEALTFYLPHTEETRKAIIAAVAKRGLDSNWTMASLLYQYNFPSEEIKPLIAQLLATNNPDGWSGGAELAAKYGDDAFMPQLIAIATTSGKSRVNAIIALVYNRTDEGIKTLQGLLNDPDPAIWTQFAVAILNAIQPSTHMAKRPLQPDDFTAENLKPLIDHLLNSNEKNSDAIWGVSLIEQFAIDAYTPRLIAIANRPNEDGARSSAIYALAFNRTDEGVKALQQLLHRSDPTIRDMTKKAIRSAYTSRENVPGRLLKPDDFDAKYQQPKIEK